MFLRVWFQASALVDKVNGLPPDTVNGLPPDKVNGLPHEALLACELNARHPGCSHTPLPLVQ